MKNKKGKLRKLLTALVIFVIFIILARTYNLPSNFTYFLHMNSKDTLFVQNEDNKWLKFETLNHDELLNTMEVLFEDTGLQVSRIKLKRQSKNLIKRINSGT